jgi:MFS family permease
MLVQSSLALTDVQLEVFMGSLNLFAMVGALSSHWISDRLGRRWSFRIAAIVFIFGTVIQSGAGGYSSLMFGRAFVGLGVGFGLAVDPGERYLFSLVIVVVLRFHYLFSNDQRNNLFLYNLSLPLGRSVHFGNIPGSTSWTASYLE